MIPLVVYHAMGDLINVDYFVNFLQKTFPGTYIVPLEIGKDMMQDMENKVLNASSEVCQILAEDPKLHEGYIAVTFTRRLQIIEESKISPSYQFEQLTE
ncbi:palmitoyl-protein thioesterase 1-like protein [Cricetulus griseus]|nr:palmitoyl-protein thioesterase 1-like protein [Cricetulus griseus]